MPASLRRAAAREGFEVDEAAVASLEQGAVLERPARPMHRELPQGAAELRASLAVFKPWTSMAAMPTQHKVKTKVKRTLRVLCLNPKRTRSAKRRHRTLS
jgi:hypothetical protein